MHARREEICGVPGTKNQPSLLATYTLAGEECAPEPNPKAKRCVTNESRDRIWILWVYWQAKMIRLWGKKGFKGGWDLPERGWVWAGTHGHSGGRVIIFWWFGDQARYLARDTSTRRHNQQLKKEKSDSTRTIGQDKQQATDAQCKGKSPDVGERGSVRARTW